MATRPVTQASYSLREREPTPSDRRTSGRGTPLRDRNIVVIDGKRFRMQIRHKATGEIVKVPPHIWENIRPATEETFGRLVEAAQTTGNHNNFKAEHIQKIQIDLSSEPYTIRYTSKASEDTEEELEEATEFTLDVSPTASRVHQHAIKQFGSISHVVSSSMAPPRPIRVSSPSDEERTVSGSRRSVGQSIEATIGRLRGGETLTTDDMMNYTTHVIQRQHPDTHFLEKRMTSAELQGVEGTAPIFAENERDQQVKAAFERDRTKPLVIYIHHHPHQHYSTIVAKGGKLFAYNPTGVPHASLDLKAIYKGIYAEEASNGDICDYSVRPELVRIYHTICETFKTGVEETDTAMMKGLWSYLQIYRDYGMSLVGVTRIALFHVLGDRYEDLGEAFELAYRAEEVDPDTKIKNMIRAATGDNVEAAGRVDTHFANAEAISALTRALTHQTDGVNCGVYALAFAEYMCSSIRAAEEERDIDANEQYYTYLESSPKPATLRGEMVQSLARGYERAVIEGQHAEFRGTSPGGLPGELVSSILTLPAFRSPSGDVNGLRPEIDRTRQVMYELSELFQERESAIQLARLTPPDADPIDGIHLFASAETPILVPETDTPAFIPGTALDRIAGSAKVYYNPEVFDDEETRAASLVPLLSGDALPQSTDYKKARRKYIISENFLIFDEKGGFIPFAPTRIGKTLTSAAPNLRDERDADLREDPVARKAHMKDLIKDQMYIFEAEGCKQLVIPAFGCGQFGWNPEEVATAYKEVLQELPAEDYEFDAVHFTLPNGEHFAVFDRVFKAGYTGHVPVYLTEKDATGVIRVLSENNIRWGELNPGNVEAQVGHNWEGTSTAYEQSRARNSAMIIGQRLDLNREQLTSPANWHP